jgi:hypothetical protein
MVLSGHDAAETDGPDQQQHSTPQISDRPASGSGGPAAARAGGQSGIERPQGQESAGPYRLGPRPLVVLLVGLRERLEGREGSRDVVYREFLDSAEVMLMGTKSAPAAGLAGALWRSAHWFHHVPGRPGRSLAAAGDLNDDRKFKQGMSADSKKRPGGVGGKKSRGRDKS